MYIALFFGASPMEAVSGRAGWGPPSAAVRAGQQGEGGAAGGEEGGGDPVHGGGEGPAGAAAPGGGAGGTDVVCLPGACLGGGVPGLPWGANGDPEKLES